MEAATRRRFQSQSGDTSPQSKGTTPLLFQSRDTSPQSKHTLQAPNQAGQSCAPPSTRNTWPVMYEASSLTRNATARATSPGWP